MKQIDIVVPYRSDYPHKDLLYCLRSIEKHVQDLGRVVIVGDLPNIIKSVTHIPAKDEPGYQRAAKNIYNKLKLAAEISDQFLVVHDDHFLLTDTVGKDYPYYHRGPINPFGKPMGYQMLLENTQSQFPGANDFDVHCPIYMTAERLKKLDILDWDKPYGYGVKTAYCVLNNIEGEKCFDLKIAQPLRKDEILKKLEGRTVFSTGSGAYTGQIEKALKHLYPKASRFEQLKIYQ
jgi:hypothetical protein